MKMLVSDYDNTFYINDEDIKNNLIKVNEFMKENLFVIATGRSYFDFKKKENLYNIKYNYLIIDHGATILKNEEVIYNKKINKDILKQLIVDLNKYNIVDIFACSLKESRLNINDNNLSKIHVKYENKEIAKEVNEFILSKYKKFINTFIVCENKAIEIVSNDSNKSNAIEYIKNIENIKNSDIFTIGDDYSDIKMISNYNGFSMINSIKELDNISNKKYNSVSNLIDDLLGD